MNRQSPWLFEAPFVSEVGTDSCSKYVSSKWNSPYHWQFCHGAPCVDSNGRKSICIRPGAGKCICKRSQGEAPPPFNPNYYGAQWLFEAPFTLAKSTTEWESSTTVLRSPQLRNDARLQAAANNSPPFRYGERGVAVQKLQQALIDLGYPMPITTKKGTPDGIYKDETFKTVQQFQRRYSLKIDGIAGRQTLSKLDEILSRPSGFEECKKECDRQFNECLLDGNTCLRKRARCLRACKGVPV